MTAHDVLTIAFLSVRVALLATLAVIVPGVAVGYVLARGRFRGKALLQTLISLPMVLPPVAVGLVLLLVFSRHAPLGRAVEATFGSPLLLTWWAAALAAAVMSFPFVVLGARDGFESVPRRLELVAASLGAPRLRVLTAITLPLAARGILHGAVFAFARALGEFGATTIVAGNIPGRTETLALGIYARIESFQDRDALILSGVSVVLALLLTGAANLFFSDTPMTHAFDLTARYPGFTLDARATWNAECTALFGASGSGKTTILEAMVGGRRDVKGSVTLADRALESLKPEKRGLGWVPQDASLFPHMTAAENIAFGVRHRGDRGAAEVVIDALEIGSIRSRSSRDLSGGESQRVAIARALASRPSFLLLDEPLASIDRPLRSRVLPFLARIPERFGISMLFVTHDPLEVLALASHVMVLESGRIVAQGDPRSVFASAALFGPLHALGAENVFDVAPDSPRDASAGILTVTTRGGCTLEMAAVPGFPAPTRVAIRSEDIMLATEQPRGISAQNVLPGTIERIEPLGDHAHVVTRASGETFRVKITSRALTSLALGAGRQVFLLIKAHAIQPCA